MIMYNTISDMCGVHRTHAYAIHCNIKEIISHATANVRSCDIISVEYPILDLTHTHTYFIYIHYI